MAVTEGGVGVEYQLALTTQPTADVVVHLAGDSQVEVSPAQIIFTPDDWDQARPVTVTAIQDQDVEGDHIGLITHTFTSDDPIYNSVAVEPVAVSITDDESPLASISVRVTDGAGTPVDRLHVGDTFRIYVYGQDLRTVGNGKGLAAAAVDLLYSTGLMDVLGVTHLAPFDSEMFGTINEAGGVVDEVGGGTAARSAINRVPQAIFYVEAEAVAAGTLSLETVAGQSGSSEILLYGMARDVRASVAYGSASVAVTVPVVTVDPLLTNDTTPALSGDTESATATIRVTVAGQTYTATNLGNGRWTLPDGTIDPPLEDGVYDIEVAAFHGETLLSSDTTSGELTIDTRTLKATITRQAPLAELTIASTLVFDVRFTDDVVNVDASDFAVATTGSVSASAALSVSDAGDADASTYTVSVNGVSGDGTLGLGVAANTDIQDVAGNLLSTTPLLNESYTIGAIDFLVLKSQTPAAGDLWYSFRTVNGATLSVEADVTDVQLVLFDELLNRLATSEQVAGRQRLDYPAAADQVFWVQLSGTAESVDVRIADLVSHEGTAVVIYGTASDDQFTFDASGAMRQISINGVGYQFAPAEAASFDFDGAGGNDDVQLLGSAGVDLAELRPRQARLEGNGYTVSAANVESATFDGGGGEDTVFLHGGPGADTLTAGGDAPGADPQRATLIGDGVSLTATAETLYAYGHGGRDTAYLYESGGDDVYQPFWRWAQMWGDPDPTVAGDEYYRQARGFKDVFKDTTATVDSASLGDSRYGGDVLQGTPADPVVRNTYPTDRVHTQFGGLEYPTTVKQSVQAGSLDDDTFEGRRIASRLSGPSRLLQAKLLDKVYAQPLAEISPLAEILWLDEFNKAKRHNNADGKPDIDIVDKAFAHWE
jgi:hypothetical protein